MKIPLYSVIYRAFQDILPPLQLSRVVKPVFAEHRNNIIINNGAEPIFGAAFPAAEIAVTYAEALAERLVQ